MGKEKKNSPRQSDTGNKTSPKDGEKAKQGAYIFTSTHYEKIVEAAIEVDKKVSTPTFCFTLHFGLIIHSKNATLYLRDITIYIKMGTRYLFASKYNCWCNA